MSMGGGGRIVRALGALRRGAFRTHDIGSKHEMQRCSVQRVLHIEPNPRGTMLSATCLGSDPTGNCVCVCGHEATDTGLAYAPVSQAHGHHHTVCVWGGGDIMCDPLSAGRPATDRSPQPTPRAPIHLRRTPRAGPQHKTRCGTASRPSLQKGLPASDCCRIGRRPPPVANRQWP